ncbi:hypothetical protein [Gimesia maris]|uniref:hypothetical protein n=1 Tax=Gimesia maris TaxID=122 RepID=UPI000E825ED3|nr:hypothetical protein [Gimesia maris]HAW29972.1 hypothetical protein [Planctomycetaceae bacterium]|tara:strand:+ start:2177 stop:2416 length:240 start_codon:yes stop_codon:yes gene_type:complete
MKRKVNKMLTPLNAYERLAETYSDKESLLAECEKIALKWQSEGQTQVSLYALLEEGERVLLQEDIQEASILGSQEFTSD